MFSIWMFDWLNVQKFHMYYLVWVLTLKRCTVGDELGTHSSVLEMIQSKQFRTKSTTFCSKCLQWSSDMTTLAVVSLQRCLALLQWAFTRSSSLTAFFISGYQIQLPFFISCEGSSVLSSVNHTFSRPSLSPSGWRRPLSSCLGRWIDATTSHSHMRLSFTGVYVTILLKDLQKRS